MAKENKNEQEEMQQKYLQFQVLQQQMEQVSQQLEMLTQQFGELEVSKEALIQLEKTPEKNEILASIAPGIFFKTSLLNNQKLIVNVGSEVAVEKTVFQVGEILEAQKREVEKSMAQSDLILKNLTQQALKIYQELENVQ